MTNNPKPASGLSGLLLLAVSAILLYILNRLFIIPRWTQINFFRAYVGDILALPAYLPLSFYLAEKLGINPSGFHLRHIVGAIVIFSLIFEGILPIFDKSSTGDMCDILAYSVGGLLVYIVQKIAQQRAQTSLTDPG